MRNQPDPTDVIALPHITLDQVLWGLGVFACGLLISYLIRFIVRRYLLWRGRSDSAAMVFSRVTQFCIALIALGAALAIIFPSVKPVDVLGGLGIVSIAAGIAFQTVLGNAFAGMAILARDRFRVGDQILIDGYAGQVAAMHLSSTAIRTFDGRMVLIPNALLHTEVVTVQTGYEEVRSSVVVDLDDRTDLAHATRVAIQAMHDVPGVADHPEPQALLTSVGSGTVSLELRFWSGARQLETREAQHAVIEAVLGAFDHHGVATGADVQVVDQRTAAPHTTDGHPAS